ncbi:uncharacterized protein LOC135209210 [Macrobrachium nipponense]|uniref:uncharacterized protein LOC135209210 n=1 Tax=Macrobrachium nipponense TaxID=159736 RepID=UPI0030C8712F
MYTSYYIESFPFNVRRLEARKVIENFPGLVPVVIEKVPTRLDMKSIRIRNVYPKGTTLREICVYLRWLLRVREDAHFAICTQGVMPSLASDMGALYENFCHADGYLYLAYNDGTIDLRKLKVVEPLHSRYELLPERQAPGLRSRDSMLLPSKIAPISPLQELCARGRLLSPEDRARNRPRSSVIQRTGQFPQHTPDQSPELAREEGALALPEEGAFALPEQSGFVLPEEGTSPPTSEDSNTDMSEEGTGEMSEHDDSDEDTDEDTVEDTDSLCSQRSFEESSFGNYYLSDSSDSSSGSSDSSGGDHSEYSYQSKTDCSLAPERPQPLHGGPSLTNVSTDSSSDSYCTASEASDSYISFHSLSPHANIEQSGYLEDAASYSPSTSQPRPTASFSQSTAGPPVHCSSSDNLSGLGLSYTTLTTPLSLSAPSLSQSRSASYQELSSLTHSLQRCRSAEAYLAVFSSSRLDGATSESCETRPGPSSE